MAKQYGEGNDNDLLPMMMRTETTSMKKEEPGQSGYTNWHSTPPEEHQ